MSEYKGLEQKLPVTKRGMLILMGILVVALALWGIYRWTLQYYDVNIEAEDLEKVMGINGEILNAEHPEIVKQIAEAVSGEYEYFGKLDALDANVYLEYSSLGYDHIVFQYCDSERYERFVYEDGVLYYDKGDNYWYFKVLTDPEVYELAESGLLLID